MRSHIERLTQLLTLCREFFPTPIAVLSACLLSGIEKIIITHYLIIVSCNCYLVSLSLLTLQS